MTLDNFPVGTVIHSMLTESQFQLAMSTGWVLSDGRTVTGSAYHKLTANTTVPDMRGRFLRGKNNGGSVNPDGDLALGTNSADKYRSHSHAHNATEPSGNYSGKNMVGTPNSSPTYSGQSTSASGGNETAPYSTTVNIFIKIN